MQRIIPESMQIPSPGGGLEGLLQYVKNMALPINGGESYPLLRGANVRNEYFGQR